MRILRRWRRTAARLEKWMQRALMIFFFGLGALVLHAATRAWEGGDPIAALFFVGLALLLGWLGLLGTGRAGRER